MVQMKKHKSPLKQTVILTCLSGRQGATKNYGYPRLSLLYAAFMLCALLVGASSCYNEYPFDVIYPGWDETAIVVLGTIQDAGSPQILCEKECCEDLYFNPDSDRKVVSLGIIDAKEEKIWMIEATPDLTAQVSLLNIQAGSDEERLPDGILLTHAHVGHYTGLMYLGKEATNATKVPVYAMPKMKNFLETNGPWSQLVSDSNMVIHPLQENSSIQLSKKVKVTPFLVPHRDEFSETIGYKIHGPNKSALFIPDIDKWSKWSKSIVEEIKTVDYAFLDATFYNSEELGNRDMSEIPHPFVVETMELLKDMSLDDKSKVYFIHFNHTNPIIDKNNSKFWNVEKMGFNIARINHMVRL